MAYDYTLRSTGDMEILDSRKSGTRTVAVVPYPLSFKIINKLDSSPTPQATQLILYNYARRYYGQI